MDGDKCLLAASQVDTMQQIKRRWAEAAESQEWSHQRGSGTKSMAARLEYCVQACWLVVFSCYHVDCFSQTDFWTFRLARTSGSKRSNFVVDSEGSNLRSRSCYSFLPQTVKFLELK